MKRFLTFFRLPTAAVTVILALLSAPAASQTNFAKFVDNPVVDLGDRGTWDQTEAAFASVFFDGEVYHMWYSGAQIGNTYQIGHATSSDGLRWTKDAANPVLGFGEQGAFDRGGPWTPWVIKDGNLLKMWYSGSQVGGQIGYATSIDGTKWSRQLNGPVLERGAAGEWDSRTVLAPIVVKRDNSYQMWYSGQSDNGTWQVGYATSSDGINWQKYNNNPVMSAGALDQWDSGSLVAGTVIFDNGMYHLWYHSVNSTEALIGLEIGYATSQDGIHWVRHNENPILLHGANPADWDWLNAWFPHVIKEGNRFRMWYSGRRSGSVDRLGYAEDFSQAAHIVDVHAKTDTSDEAVVFEVAVANPHLAKIAVKAVVRTVAGQYVDTVPMKRLAGGYYWAEWEPPLGPQTLHMGAELQNFSDNYVHNSFDWGLYEVFRSIVTSVEEEKSEQLPAEFELAQNTPNPFNPTTTIRFSLLESGHTTLVVQNVLGSVVATLVDGQMSAGRYRIHFDASRLAAGVYYYTLTSGKYRQTRKMALLK